MEYQISTELSFLIFTPPKAFLRDPVLASYM